jgi:hypothetical protein
MNNIISFLVFYFPRKSGRSDSVSDLILQFKDGHPAAIDHFRPMILHWINCFISYRPVYLCTVPSCRISSCNTITGLASEIASITPGLVDATHFVRTVRSRKSSCMSGVRNPIMLLRSLAFADDINGKHILLLDDITTTGTSLTTIREELIRRGALSVRCLAIAQTYSPW